MSKEEIVKKIKIEIKKIDIKLYNDLIYQKISDQQIFDNQIMFERYILDASDLTLKFKTKIFAENGLIYETVFNSDYNDEILTKIKSNYISPLISNKFYEYRINKDLLKTANRTELMKAFKSLLSNNFQKKGIWISGEFGLGKTFSAICVLNKYAELDSKVGFYLFPDLVSKINGTISSSFDNKEKLYDILEVIKNVDLVLFDDIGSEKASSWFRDNFLFPLLNHRFDNDKITIFTSNLSIDEYFGVLKQRTPKGTLDDKIDSISTQRVIKRLKDNLLEINLKK